MLDYELPSRARWKQDSGLVSRQKCWEAARTDLMFLTGNVRVRTDSEQQDIKLNVSRGWNKTNY